MAKSKILGSVISILTLFSITLSNSPGSENKIVVGSNIQVSKARENQGHNEVLFAADPKKPDHLLGASMIFSEEENKYFTIVYASFDGGKTWTPTLDTRNCRSSFDPACAYGPDGAAYYAALGEGEAGKYSLWVYRSKDGGKTWSTPTVLPAIDREYIVVDNTGGKYKGRLYIHGTGGVKPLEGERFHIGVTIYRSLDGGVRFEQMVNLASIGNHYILGMGNSAVLSDGTLVILFGELRDYGWEGDKVPKAMPSEPNAWLKVVTSEDGGETFSKASVVSDFYMDWPPYSSSAIPYLAVDQSHGPFKDRLYAVWPDMRSGRDEILFSYSSDKGKTWSKPLGVNDDSPPPDSSQGLDNFMPVVATNSDGIVGVMWYDRRENPDNVDWWVRFTASLDGGVTFLPSVKVSEAPFNHGKDNKWIVGAHSSGGGNPVKQLAEGNINLNVSVDGFYFNGGHTAGMAADAKGVFHPLWVDNRTGIPQLWTAGVTVHGNVMPHGSADLAGLEDITKDVTIELTNSHYDRSKNIYSVNAQLLNTSGEILGGPIKVRMIRLESEVGKAEVLNADNGEKGAGAVWDFSHLIKEDKLKPKEKSEIKRLEFSLSVLRPLRRGRDFKFGLLNLETKVLGKVEEKPFQKK